MKAFKVYYFKGKIICSVNVTANNANDADKEAIRIKNITKQSIHRTVFDRSI